MDEQVITKEGFSEICTIRDVIVFLDADLAKLYNVNIKVLHQEVKRNIERFSEDFMFQLTKTEYEETISKNVINNKGGRRNLPFAFTRQGVVLLSSILGIAKTAKIHIELMKAFAEMRELIDENIKLKKQYEILKSIIDKDVLLGYEALWSVLERNTDTGKL